MQAFLMICIGLLLASCGGEKQPKSTVAAIESGEKTRMEWQKARKPVEIHIEGMEGTSPAWPHIGVYMDVSSPTPEERQAFAGTAFTRKGDVMCQQTVTRSLPTQWQPSAFATLSGKDWGQTTPSA